MMISTFLDESYANPQNSVIQNQLSRFMSDDSDANFNETLEDLILGSKINLLEPLFELVLRPTKEFSKSFIQEKAIYKRNSESLSNIVNLANLAVEEGNSRTILNFVLVNTKISTCLYRRMLI
jgi:hypothetical protein